MSESVPVWVAIALPFLGYAVAVGTEFIRGWQSRSREREARRDARLAEREEARYSFEMDNLLEIQEAAGRLMRNTGAIFLETEREYSKTGTWGRKLLSDEIGGEPSVILARDFEKLRVRILDESLRQLAGAWWKHGAASAICAMRDEDDDDARLRASADWSRCVELYRELNERLGERLRILVCRSEDGEG